MKCTPLVLLLLSLAIWGCMPTEPSTQSTPKASDTLAPVVAKDTVSPEIRESLGSLLVPASIGWWQPLQDISALFNPAAMIDPNVDTTFPVFCFGPMSPCAISRNTKTTILEWKNLRSWIPEYIGSILSGSITYPSSLELDSVVGDSSLDQSERLRLASALIPVYYEGHSGGVQGGSYGTSRFLRTTNTEATRVFSSRESGDIYPTDSIGLLKEFGSTGWGWLSWALKKGTIRNYTYLNCEALEHHFYPTGPKAFGTALATWKLTDYTFTKATLRFAPDSEFVEALEGRDNSGFDSVWMAGTKSDSIRWTTFAKKGDTTRMAWHRPDLRHIRMDSLYVHKSGLSGGSWTDIVVHFSWDSTISGPLEAGILTKVDFRGLSPSGDPERFVGAVKLMDSPGKTVWTKLSKTDAVSN